MRNKFFSYIFVLLFSSIFWGCFSFAVGLSRAAGPIDTYTLISGNLKNLEVSGPFDVILVPGSQVKARMNQQIFASIIVTEDPSGTSIAPRKGLILRDSGTTELLIGVDTLNSLNIRTTRRISTDSPISKKSFNLTLGGVISGSLDLNIENLSLNIDTPGAISVNGKVINLTLDARTSMAQVNLKNLDIVNKPTLIKPIHGTRIKL